MSKKAAALFIILLILLFLTGYSISKRIRENRGQPINQSYSHSISIHWADSFDFVLKDAA